MCTAPLHRNSGSIIANESARPLSEFREGRWKADAYEETCERLREMFQGRRHEPSASRGSKSPWRRAGSLIWAQNGSIVIRPRPVGRGAAVRGPAAGIEGKFA